MAGLPRTLATMATSFSILTVPVTVSPALYALLSSVTVSVQGGASAISLTVVCTSGTDAGGDITSRRVMVGASGSGAGVLQHPLAPSTNFPRMRTLEVAVMQRGKKERASCQSLSWWRGRHGLVRLHLGRLRADFRCA